MVRRAVAVLLTIAAVSGLVFNAFTLLLPKLMEERLASSPDLLPVVGMLAFLATLCGGLTQFTVGHMIDRHTLKKVFLPLALVQVPCLLLLSVVQGWLVLPLAAVMAASIFGQVTVNETMTARYVAPALRVKLYPCASPSASSGAATASPLVGFLHEGDRQPGRADGAAGGASAPSPSPAPWFPQPARGVAARARAAQGPPRGPPRWCRPRRNSPR